MFNRIVVPLDGTPFAEAALAPACELARAFGSRLAVVRAIPAWGLPHAVRRPDEDDADTAFELLDDADAYLHAVVARLQRDTGLHAGIALYITAPGDAIARAAEVDHADLIVMTAHPRWRVNVLDNHSTSLRVLARTRVSILAWRFGSDRAQDVLRPV
jgi:nucleotide-binding universal stress UspA family protein